MILFYIYMATVILAVVGTILIHFETKAYCKEHRIVNAHKLSLSRRLLNEVQILLMCIIPLYNILVGISSIATFLSSSMFETAIQTNLDKGVFMRKED